MPEIKLHLDGVSAALSAVIKNIGVTFDPELSFETHIQKHFCDCFLSLEEHFKLGRCCQYIMEKG